MAVEARIKKLTDQIMADNWIDATSHKLIQSLEGNTASRAGAQPTALPMPTTQKELQKGAVYNTARGPAIWNGTAFEPIQ
jgi:hypothetical protein